METKRLVLRKPTLSDFDSYWEMKNDEEVTKYTGGITPYSYEERKSLFQDEWITANQNTEFSIIKKEDNTYIGYIGFMEQENQDPELLFGLLRFAWRQGLGYEAAKQMLTYGFEKLQYKTIMATVEVENIGSIKLLEKLGMCRIKEYIDGGKPVYLYCINKSNI